MRQLLLDSHNPEYRPLEHEAPSLCFVAPRMKAILLTLLAVPAAMVGAVRTKGGVRSKSCKAVGVMALPEVSKTKPGPLVQGVGNLRWNLGKYPYKTCDAAAESPLDVLPTITVLTSAGHAYFDALRSWALQVHEAKAECAIVALDETTCAQAKSLHCSCYRSATSRGLADSGAFDERPDKGRRTTRGSKAERSRLQNYVKDLLNAGLQILKSGRSVLLHNPDYVFLPDGMRRMLAYVTTASRAGGKFKGKRDFVLRYNGDRSENFNDVNWGLTYFGNSTSTIETLQCILDLWDSGSAVGRSRILELAMTASNEKKQATPSPRVCLFSKRILQTSLRHMNGFSSVDHKFLCARSEGLLADPTQFILSYDVPNDESPERQRQALIGALIIAMRYGRRVSLPLAFSDKSQVPLCSFMYFAHPEQLQGHIAASTPVSGCTEKGSNWLSDYATTHGGVTGTLAASSRALCADFSRLVQAGRGYRPDSGERRFDVALCAAQDYTDVRKHPCSQSSLRIGSENSKREGKREKASTSSETAKRQHKREEPRLLDILRITMARSATVRCKAWDAGKCDAVDYGLSYSNSLLPEDTNFKNITVDRKCRSKFDYTLLEMDAHQRSFKPPRCDEGPLRGLILTSPSSVTQALINDAIAPALEKCCGLSFDAVSSMRLRRAANEVLSSGSYQSGDAANAIHRAIKHALFFIRDDGLLQIGHSGPVGTSAVADGVGFLMSSNGRFLETARSMIRVLRKSSSAPITMVLPDEIQEKLPEDWFGVPGVTTAKLKLPEGALPSFGREYGFRLHKLPMLLKPPYSTTFYIDSDIFVCGPHAIERLVKVTQEAKKSDVFCIREGVRRTDKVNYVHGGLLAFRPQSALSHSFVRSWLRIYLVVMSSLVDKKGSIFEQPSLTLVSDSTQQALGGSAVHFFDGEMLARSHLVGGVEPYRQNITNGSGYAADLVHFNPLKEWPLVKEMIVDTGCGNFRQPAKIQKEIDVLFL